MFDDSTGDYDIHAVDWDDGCCCAGYGVYERGNHWL